MFSRGTPATSLPSGTDHFAFSCILNHCCSFYYCDHCGGLLLLEVLQKVCWGLKHALTSTVENGTKVEFFSLSHGSHFGPIGIDVARIIVIRSGEEQPTDSDVGHLPPHEPIDEHTIVLSVGIPIAFIVIVIILPSLLVLVCFLYRKHSKHKKYVLKSADATCTCRPRVSRIGVTLCTSVCMYVQYEGVYYLYNCYCLDTECYTIVNRLLMWYVLVLFTKAGA